MVGTVQVRCQLDEKKKKNEETKMNFENTNVWPSLLLTIFLVHPAVGRGWWSCDTSKHVPGRCSHTITTRKTDEVSYPILSNVQILILLCPYPWPNLAVRRGVTRQYDRHCSDFSLSLCFLIASLNICGSGLRKRKLLSPHKLLRTKSL